LGGTSRSISRWFRELTEKNLRRGIFASVPDLIANIEHYLAVHNDEPKPYKWTATADPRQDPTRPNQPRSSSQSN
jgi:hypothetical protein